MSRNLTIGWKLLLGQSWKAISRRQGRSFVTAIGVALGVAVFVVTIGWSQTVSAQVNSTFDELSATEIRLRDLDEVSSEHILNDDFQSQIESLPNVTSAGRLLLSSQVSAGRFPKDPDPVDLSVIAADPGSLMAAQVTLATGRTFDDGAVRQGLPVAVLGPRAAKNLGLGDVDGVASLWVEGVGLQVIGILKDSGRAPELSSAIIVPAGVQIGALDTSGGEATALIRVELGTAETVAAALPTAIWPQDPNRVGVILAPEVTKLRDDVQTSLNGLAMGGALFSLIIGGLGIMNSMLIAVTQRSAEVGLRRALGARPHQIVVQFLAEGVLLGALGAILGTAAGCAALWTLATVNDWHPILDRWVFMAGLGAGTIVGLVATIYPSLRAAQIHPAETLRS